MDIQGAAAILRGGGLVAFPTETVYGLGADASSDAAVRRLLAVKRRPEGQAVSVLLPPEADFSLWAGWSAEAEALAARLWPGPLTLVLPRTPRVSPVVTGGRDTVGLRVPDHPVALALLRAFGGGLATPSANRSRGLSPTTAEHVRAELGDEVDRILDGGPCALGLESTVLLLGERPRVLRPGAVTLAQLEAILGQPVDSAAPAPSLDLSARVVLLSARHLAERLDADPGRCGVIALTLPQRPGLHWVQAPPDPERYGSRLYATLRELREAGCPVIYVESPPSTPEWSAVRHRLARASGGEPSPSRE